MDTFDEKKAQSYLDQPLPELLDEIALYDTTTRGASDVWQNDLDHVP